MQVHASPDWLAEYRRLEGAYAPATLKSYRVDMQIFADWCAVRQHCPLPADIPTICTFLGDQAAHGLAASTIQRRLYAIRKTHRLLRLPDPTCDVDIAISLRRIQRMQPCRPRQARGLTRDVLDRCLAVPGDDPWSLRNRAMLSLGYDLLTRRSELIALQSVDVQWQADGTLRALIRRSKADPFGMGRIAFGSRRSALLLRTWLDWRGSHIAPLFCAIYHRKPIDRALGTTTVKQLIKQAVAAAGEPPETVQNFSGHSLRVGAAQDLLCAGFDAAAIMRAGGWKSMTVLLRYLEHAEHNVWA